jgi:hypothetical protein
MLKLCKKERLMGAIPAVIKDKSWCRAKVIDVILRTHFSSNYTS